MPRRGRSVDSTSSTPEKGFGFRRSTSRARKVTGTVSKAGRNKSKSRRGSRTFGTDAPRSPETSAQTNRSLPPPPQSTGKAMRRTQSGRKARLTKTTDKQQVKGFYDPRDEAINAEGGVKPEKKSRKFGMASDTPPATQSTEYDLYDDELDGDALAEIEAMAEELEADYSDDDDELSDDVDEDDLPEAGDYEGLRARRYNRDLSEDSEGSSDGEEEPSHRTRERAGSRARASDRGKQRPSRVARTLEEDMEPQAREPSKSSGRKKSKPRRKVAKQGGSESGGKDKGKKAPSACRRFISAIIFGLVCAVAVMLLFALVGVTAGSDVSWGSSGPGQASLPAGTAGAQREALPGIENEHALANRGSEGSEMVGGVGHREGAGLTEPAGQSPVAIGLAALTFVGSTLLAYALPALVIL